MLPPEYDDSTYQSPDAPSPMATRAPKSPWLSKGVTGSGGAALLALITLITAYQETGTVPEAEAALLVATAISALIGLIGRIKAKRPIAL